jgi:hypothetical protein
VVERGDAAERMLVKVGGLAVGARADGREAVREAFFFEGHEDGAAERAAGDAVNDEITHFGRLPFVNSQRP